MLEEMRHAGVYARITAETPFNVTSGDVFRCATLGGARLLGRSDIGRLAVGAKPDVVLVDLTHPMMQPTREPLRSLIYAAAERAVRHVFVAGRQVVKDGKVLTMDYAAAAAGVNESQKRALANVPVARLGRPQHRRAVPRPRSATPARTCGEGRASPRSP